MGVCRARLVSLSSFSGEIHGVSGGRVGSDMGGRHSPLRPDPSLFQELPAGSPGTSKSRVLSGCDSEGSPIGVHAPVA